MRPLFLLFLAITLCAAERRNDIEFAKPGGFSLTLDASIPDGPGPHPALVIVHGGGFIAGDKQTYVPPLFPVLEKGGYAWFSINYRLAPKFHFDDSHADVAAAMDWVVAHAAEYRVDPKRIGIVGESAGGTIVAYFGVTAKGAQKPKVVVDLYGISDWVRHEQIKAHLSTNAASWLAGRDLKKASAMTYLYKDMPPFLFIHGTADQSVPHEHSPNMCAAMKKVGAICEVYTMPGATHGMGGWERNPDFQGWKPKMIEWLDKNLR